MNKSNLIKTLISISILIFTLSFVNADNWVCYDSTGKVTTQQLRDKMFYQKGSPLQIINTASSSVSYTQSTYFTTCGNSNTFTYCPENEYFLKTTITNAQRCESFSGAHHQYTMKYSTQCTSSSQSSCAPLIAGVDCGLGGGPSCNKFSSASGSGTPQYEFVCGKNNDKWQTMTASSNWDCPECKELALRQNGVEPQMGDIESFRDLSFGSQFKFSGDRVDLSFMVFILACINRVPMVNLEVELIDKLTNQPVTTEHGIYAKHETLDYNEDNLGMLKDFYVPNQEEFKKSYTLKGTLSGYRAWAWRTRLADAMEKVTNKYGLTVPGYPTNRNDLKQGNLYYSPDFLTAKNSLNGAVTQGDTIAILSQAGSINVLKNINRISGQDMCTVSDLENYINSNGVNQNFLNEIDEVIPLIDGATYTDVTISSGSNENVEFSKSNIKVTKSDIGDEYKDVDKWYKRFEDLSSTRQLNELIDMGVITEDNLKSIARGTVSGWYDYSPNLGCSNFEYTISNLKIEDYSKRTEDEKTGTEEYNETQTVIVAKNETVERTEIRYNETSDTYYDVIVYENRTVYVEEEVNVTKTRDVKEKVMYFNIDFNSVWENNIVANLELEYEKKVSSSYSWDFASLEDLDSETLAACMYNWDECMLKQVNDNGRIYKEVVDCGMGPPSNLAEPTMKDGARGKKTITQDVVIYRGCFDGDDWISKYKGYACVDGKYYRCKFGADAGDFLLGVIQAGVGDTLIRKDSNGFVCTNRGWEDIACGP